jgi:hypothetical protein
MKTKFLSILFTLTLLVGATSLLAQGTAFTYQGRLNDGTNPASGIYDLRFTILDANAGGNLIGGPLTNSVNFPSNGILTVTLDFGADVFNGAGRWLEIGVRTNGAVAFDTLFERQAITPTPYAIQATTAANLTGVVIANGAGLTNLTGANVVGAVRDAVHAASATNAPDGKPLVSNKGVTNIVTLINSNNVLNVRDFGAYGDNAHDDWQAFQSALLSKPSPNIFVPRGVYKLSQALNIISNGTTLFGAGSAEFPYGSGSSTVLNFTSTSNGIVFATPDLHSITVKDLSVFGPGETLNQGAAFCITNGLGSTLGCRFENLNVDGWNIAFNINGMAINNWLNCSIQNCNYGIYNVDSYTPFSMSWIGGAIVDCNNVFSKSYWTFISCDMGNQMTGNFMIITNGAKIVFVNCNMEQNISANTSPMIFADIANIEMIGGRFSGNNGPVIAVSNAVSVAMIGTALASSTIAPIWSYTDNEHVSDDGTFHPAVTNIPNHSLYNANPPGMGHTFAATLRIQALTNPSLRFSMFIDELADFRGTTLSFVGKMFGVWQPMDLLEYYKDKRFGVIPLLNSPNTGNITTSGTSTAGYFAGNGGGLTNLNATNLVGTIADARLSTNVAMKNTDQTFSSNVTIGGFPIIAQSSASPANNATLTPTTGYVKLSPAAAVSLNSTTAIADGGAIGTTLILEGSSDASTVTVPNAANTRLSAAHTLGNRDTLILLWNGSDWVELSYSNK